MINDMKTKYLPFLIFTLFICTLLGAKKSSAISFLSKKPNISTISSAHPMTTSTVIVPTGVSPATETLPLFTTKQSFSAPTTLVSGVDYCCAITVTDTNVVHIAYSDQSEGGIFHLTNESGTWISTVVDATSYSEVSSIAIAVHNNKAHIIYTAKIPQSEEIAVNYLKYASSETSKLTSPFDKNISTPGKYIKSNTSESWTVEIIETGGGIDADSPTQFLDLAIAIDDSNKVHIVYEEFRSWPSGGRYILHYQSKSSSSWDDEIIDDLSISCGVMDSPATYFGPSLALDNSDNPAIAFYEPTTNSVKMASRSEGTWSTETIATTTLGANDHVYTSVDFDSDNQAHVVYETGTALVHAKKTRSWRTDTISTTASGNIASLSGMLTSADQMQNVYCSKSYKLEYTFKSFVGSSETELGSCYTGKVALTTDNNNFLYLAYSYGSKLMYQSSYIDTDGDGTLDSDDTDDDNDGVLDTEDALPNDSTETIDTDGDGIGNNADTDDDGDGIDDSADSFPTDPNETTDTDGDGIGNNADTDRDGDGILNSTDNCVSVANSDQADSNADGVGNACPDESGGLGGLGDGGP